ncbi:hypothetical protein Tco_0079414 [Tanacetum coccineum]
MANLSEDIQCAGSDTRPPMLDKADFASWQQRIRLYCRGKDNGINILKSIDEGPFQMGTTQGIIDEGTEAPVDEQGYSGKIGTNKGRPSGESQLYDDFENFRQNKGENLQAIMFGLQAQSMEHAEHQDGEARVRDDRGETRCARVCAGRGARELVAVRAEGQRCERRKRVLQPKEIKLGSMRQGDCSELLQGRQNRGQERNSARGAGTSCYGSEHRIRMGNANPVSAGRTKMLLMQSQRMVADDCDAYDSDVDDAPTAQTLFMANLSSADPVYDEAGPSYDSEVLSEVQAHDHYQDAVCDHHEEHEMHDDVQPNHVVDSHADYTSDSNMTPYDQYVKDNAVPVVQNKASKVPNDAYVMIDNDLHESDVTLVSHTHRNTVANNLLNAKLATYKEQVETV